MILVIVIDGATDVFFLTENARHIAGIVDYFQELYSPIPVTVPAFPTIFTGHWADRHGLHSFERPDGSLRNAHDLSPSTPYIWTQLGKSGYSVGVVNLPMTYPISTPPLNTKFMVTGFDAPFPGAENTVFPENLDLHGYTGDVLHLIQVNPNTEQKMVNRAFMLQTAVSVCKARTKKILQWCDEYGVPDVLFLNIPEWDRVAHFCYSHREMMNMIVEVIDDQVNMLHVALSPDHTIICSDHGFASRNDQSEKSRYYRTVFSPLGPNMEGVHTTSGIFCGENIAHVLPAGGPVEQVHIAPMIMRLAMGV